MTIRGREGAGLVDGGESCGESMLCEGRAGSLRRHKVGMSAGCARVGRARCTPGPLQLLLPGVWVRRAISLDGDRAPNCAYVLCKVSAYEDSAPRWRGHDQNLHVWEDRKRAGPQNAKGGTGGGRAVYESLVQSADAGRLVLPLAARRSSCHPALAAARAVTQQALSPEN
jgi:hypothetical protein